MKPLERIAFLRKELSKHNHAYYVKDAPVISDFNFDQLLNELQELEINHPGFFDANSPRWDRYKIPYIGREWRGSCI